MDALMFDEVLALCQGTLSQEEFNEKLVIRKHRFNCVLESQVKDMLPDKNLPKIGNGFQSVLVLCYLYLRIITRIRRHLHLETK